MLISANAISSIINVVLVASGIAALAWVFKGQKSKDLSDLQGKIIETQKDALATQDTRIRDLQANVDRLNQTLATIRVVFQRRGTVIHIDGEYITLEDRRPNGPTQTVVRISSSPKTPDVPSPDPNGTTPEESTP